METLRRQHKERSVDSRAGHRPGATQSVCSSAVMLEDDVGLRGGDYPVVVRGR